jgi:hypothetical protein
MHRDAAADLSEYIEVFYNRSRRHSSLGFVSPNQFLQDWLKAQTRETAAQLGAFGWRKTEGISAINQTAGQSLRAVPSRQQAVGPSLRNTIIPF